MGSHSTEFMEEHIAKVCDDGTIPGVVLMAKSKSGKFEYAWNHGKRSAKENAGQLGPDTLLMIASGTKLIVSICAMQCVERGLIGLDDDVTKFVTELKDVQVLSGFDENDNPIVTKPSNKLTLRRLLTHSSGWTYDFFSPNIVKWHEKNNRELQNQGPTLIDRFSFPLDFEPGTGWMYGASIDWAGRVVERVTNQRLEEYMQANVCRPLGMHRTTFYPQQHPDILAGHANTAIRNQDTGAMEHKEVTYWDEDPIDCFGGHGCYSTAHDLFAMLQSLLLDDQRVLSSASLAEFFRPQLSSEAKAALKKNLAEKSWLEDWNVGGSYPVGSERDHTLCGMYLCEELPVEQTPRRKGTVTWAGMPNVYWSIDREAGLCTLYASQVEPTWDKASKDLLRLFERTMYERMYEAEGTAA